MRFSGSLAYVLILMTGPTPSLLAGAAQPSDAATVDQALAGYRDKDRVLLVFAPSDKDPAFVEQARLWQGEKAGFDERQLVIVPVLADGKRAAGGPPGEVAKKYDVDPLKFAVVLLGKDGHDAFRAARPVKPGALYDVIDAMPMRRVEMKRQAAARPVKADTDHSE